MPIYEYQCGTCGGRVEVLVRSTASRPACPECGSPLTDKLFSTPHILSSQPRRLPGHTCCGQEERCDTPPCSGGGTCRHD
ncbi:MAG: zinc ribbon domain-containing protein [Anaerolineae bacterium]|jgi:putative FmdB family regulatory protein